MIEERERKKMRERDLTEIEIKKMRERDLTEIERKKKKERERPDGNRKKENERERPDGNRKKEKRDRPGGWRDKGIDFMETESKIQGDLMESERARECK